VLNIGYMVIPHLGDFCGSLKENVPCSVNNFFLTVTLWMEICTPLQLGVHHSPQTCPKLSKESSILIRDNGCGKPNVDPNILKEDIGSLLSSDLVFTWNQDTHLSKPIHYYIQVVMTPFQHC
jgi:hypothetical protein